MNERSFIGDILEQPESLRKAVPQYPAELIETLMPRIKNGEINRIVLAAHGSSYNALYPAFLHLSKLSIPVSMWLTAELLNYGREQIDTRTLLCLNSQSGQSIEVKRLVTDLGKERPACITAFTNYADSSLGMVADIIIPLHAGEEHGVAAKTYINPLALSLMFSVQLSSGDVEKTKGEFLALSDAMEDFLIDWESKVENYMQLLGNFDRIIVVGRGPAMASALNSAINQKEASWSFSEGMNAAEFRHGPLELADQKLTLIIMEGDEITREFNRTLAKEVQGYGSNVIWVGNHADMDIKSIKTPAFAAITQPVADILPMQLVAQAIADKKGIEAGKFRRIGKIVLKE